MRKIEVKGFGLAQGYNRTLEANSQAAAKVKVVSMFLKKPPSEYAKDFIKQLRKSHGRDFTRGFLFQFFGASYVHPKPTGVKSKVKEALLV